jgi:hypothetical protein
VIGWKCSCITRSELRGASCEDWKSALRRKSSTLHNKLLIKERSSMTIYVYTKLNYWTLFPLRVVSPWSLFKINEIENANKIHEEFILKLKLKCKVIVCGRGWEFSAGNRNGKTKLDNPFLLQSLESGNFVEQFVGTLVIMMSL